MIIALHARIDTHGALCYNKSKEGGEKVPRFYSIIENAEHRIGCTGQTVWVWNKNDIVLAKFKDLIYAYVAAISPCGDMFVVKSAEGRLAVYSLKTLSLIKKFRFSKVNYSQDDGFCFSPDGKYFLNVERQKDDLHSAISIYNTSDFSLVSRLTVSDDMMINQIQPVNDEYYVLGFDRGGNLMNNSYFIAKFRDNTIYEKVKITENEYNFYRMHLRQTLFGSMLDDGESVTRVHTLEKLWSFYNQKR